MGDNAVTQRLAAPQDYGSFYLSAIETFSRHEDRKKARESALRAERDIRQSQSRQRSYGLLASIHAQGRDAFAEMESEADSLGLDEESKARYLLTKSAELFGDTDEGAGLVGYQDFVGKTTNYNGFKTLLRKNYDSAVARGSSLYSSSTRTEYALDPNSGQIVGFDILDAEASAMKQQQLATVGPNGMQIPDTSAGYTLEKEQRAQMLAETGEKAQNEALKNPADLSKNAFDLTQVAKGNNWRQSVSVGGTGKNTKGYTIGGKFVASEDDDSSSQTLEAPADGAGAGSETVSSLEGSPQTNPGKSKVYEFNDFENALAKGGIGYDNVRLLKGLNAKGGTPQEKALLDAVALAIPKLGAPVKSQIKAELGLDLDGYEITTEGGRLGQDIASLIAHPTLGEKAISILNPVLNSIGAYTPPTMNQNIATWLNTTAATTGFSGNLAPVGQTQQTAEQQGARAGYSQSSGGGSTYTGRSPQAIASGNMQGQAFGNMALDVAQNITTKDSLFRYLLQDQRFKALLQTDRNAAQAELDRIFSQVQAQSSPPPKGKTKTRK